MWQLLARSPEHVLRCQALAIDPSRTAALPVRSQILTCDVRGQSRASSGRPISPSVLRMRSSEIRLRNGDCSSCTSQAAGAASRRTLSSPVVFLKSARTIVSFVRKASVRLRKGRYDTRRRARQPTRSGDRRRSAWQPARAWDTVGPEVAPVQRRRKPDIARRASAARRSARMLRGVLIAESALLLEALEDDHASSAAGMSARTRARAATERAVQDGVEELSPGSRRGMAGRPSPSRRAPPRN